MFGIFRFVLAIFVVIAHILQPPGLSIIGGYAVYGFFILSGYLMTLVMNRRYGFTPGGIEKFLLNRFLRIYPTYWLSLIFSIVLLAIYIPSELQKYHSLPVLLSSIFVFGLAKGGFFSLSDMLLAPPAWTLEIELTFYIFIALGLGKKKLAVPWLLFTLFGIFLVKIYNAIASQFTHQNYGFSYGSLPYASLAFVAGSFIFHYQEKIVNFLAKIEQRLQLNKAIIITAFGVIFLANLLLGERLPKGCSFPINAIVMALMIAVLATIDPNPSTNRSAIDRTFGRVRKPLYLMQSQFDLIVSQRLPGAQIKQAQIDAKSPHNSMSVDKILGGISYPIYLMHPQFAFLISKWWPELSTKGWELFCGSLPLIILGSLFVHLAIERPIENLRNSVKKSTVR
jgi:peptidoglycan/LPS O-acetylase OafA/YrhL